LKGIKNNMGTILLIIIVVAVVFGIGAFIFSHQADPKERAKEAANAAVGGAAASAGCMFQMILYAIPVLIGLFLIGLVLRSCS
jgi:hypothetical protein